MTDNMEEFEQDDQFETFDTPNESAQKGTKSSFASVWRDKPVVKLLVIMVGVSAALAVVLSSSSKDKAPNVSQLAKAPAMREAPGGSATPFFIEQNDQANDLRVGQALSQGGSAMPTPVGRDTNEKIVKDIKQDPMKEFREETDRLKNELHREQAENARKLQLLEQTVAVQNTQNTQRAMKEDDSLARAMQQQLQKTMEGWEPKRAAFVSGVQEPEPAASTPLDAMTAQQASVDAGYTPSSTEKAKVIVPAGTVNYMQLLVEANSDIPGPIMAQILSGPLSGGRAIGSFQVMNDYMVMKFSVVSYKGKDYSIDGLALDPNTTLGGMATEVDHRYMTRVVLPAAGAFVSAFGQALSDTESSTVVSDGVTVQQNAKKGMEEALYSGLGTIGQTVSQFFQQQANQTKVLVRVAVGTPMGLFFLSPVTDAPGSYENVGRLEGGDEASPIYSKNGTAGDSPANKQMEMINQMMSNMSSMMPKAASTSPSSR